MISKPLLAVLLSLAAPAVAGDFRLSLPLECDLQSDCYIQQYVDHDTSGDAADFRCSTLSYDGHKGTDFALPDLARMASGVPVLAAASGRVIATRDGMEDTGFTAETADSVKGRECGNGVVLAHANGWETQYCHLKSGTVAVIKGAQVLAGDKIADVGLSGRTEFPHLHLSLRKDGAVVDPFSPSVTGACNPAQSTSLWDPDVPYRAGGIVTAGFAANVPNFDAVKAGLRSDTHLPDNAKTIVVFVHAFGAQNGDRLHIEIEGPSGIVTKDSFKIRGNKARVFRALGARLRADHWPHGTYSGKVRLLRSGQAISDETMTVIVP